MSAVITMLVTQAEEISRQMRKHIGIEISHSATTYIAGVCADKRGNGKKNYDYFLHNEPGLWQFILVERKNIAE